MRNTHKKLTAGALVVMLGLSCMVYPVHAEEVQVIEQTDTGGLLEVDETAVPMEESTEPQATPTPEAGEPQSAPTPEISEPEPVTQGKTESEADKEEIISESAETEQETPKDSVKQANGEAEPQEQTETVNTLSSVRARTIRIGNANDLMDFATKINNGTYSEDTNAVLTGNIDMNGKSWTPIAEGSKSYKGIFDGQGYTIKNINCSGSFKGTFRNVDSSSVIKNLGVTGSFSGGQCVAGIAVYNNGLIENCWNGATITVTQHQGAGIVAEGGGIVRNCYNIGTINTPNGGDPHSAGIAGTGGTLENCFNFGTVTGNAGAIYGDGEYVSTTNCYYLENSAPRGWGGTSKTEAQVKSGEVAWLLNGNKSDGVWKQTIGTDKYPNFTGKTVYQWSDNTYHNEQQEKAPAPTFTTSQTASSITVNLTNYQSDYGQVQYKWDNGDWGTGDTLSNSGSNVSHTVSVRYMGQEKYAQSDEKKQDVKTKSAGYIISIPAVTLEAGKKDSTASISVDDKKAFDLGYNGHVDVTIKDNGNVTTDAKLKLKRTTGTQEEITSALLVNGTALGNINNNVATFTMNSKTPVSVSFAEPTEKDIPAGTYSVTITFGVSYSEQ